MFLWFSIRIYLTYVRNLNTQSEVRSHFGCSNLIGAELENQGGDATVGSHWEKRIFEVIWKRHIHSHEHV